MVGRRLPLSVVSRTTHNQAPAVKLKIWDFPEISGNFLLRVGVLYTKIILQQNELKIMGALRRLVLHILYIFMNHCACQGWNAQLPPEEHYVFNIDDSGNK